MPLRIPSAGTPLHSHNLLKALSGLWQTHSSAFQTMLSNRLDKPYLTLVNSGTTACYLALKALASRSSRREVVIPAYTAPEPVNTYVDELRQFDQLPKRIHPEIPADIPLKQSFYIEDYWPGSVLNSAFPSALVFPESRREDPGASTLITSISQTEGLRRLVELNWPGHLPWGLDGFLDMMRDLAACTPCYTIRCGTSLDDVPEKIGELMDGWKGRRVV